MITDILSGIESDEKRPEKSEDDTSGGNLPVSTQKLKYSELTKRIGDCYGPDSALLTSVRKLETFVRM